MNGAGSDDGVEAEYGIKWELLFEWYRRVATSKLI